MVSAEHGVAVKKVTLYVTLGAFAVARLSALGAPVRYLDTASYLRVELGGLRLPTVPLLYAAVGSDGARVLAQVLVAIACWSAAAVLVGALAAGWVRYVAGAAVLLVGLVPAVTMWDSMLLSESVSISLLVVGLALWLNIDERPALLPWAVAVTCAWVMCRHVHLFGGLVALGYVLRWRRRWSAVALSGAVAVNLAGWLFGGDGIASHNGDELAARVGIDDPGRYVGYVVTHPAEWVRALAAVPEYGSTWVRYYWPAPSVLPGWAVTLLWTSSALLLVGIAVAGVVAVRHRMGAWLALLCVLIGTGAATWLLAAAELQRLMSPVGAGTRLLVITALAGVGRVSRQMAVESRLGLQAR